jgi:DNA-binding protein Fis
MVVGQDCEALAVDAATTISESDEGALKNLQQVKNAINNYGKQESDPKAAKTHYDVNKGWDSMLLNVKHNVNKGNKAARELGMNGVANRKSLTKTQQR